MVGVSLFAPTGVRVASAGDAPRLQDEAAIRWRSANMDGHTVLVRLGQSLGTKVVAEGVENEGQARHLRRRRCDEVQGYLYGRPMPAADFEQLHLAACAAQAA